MFFFFTYRGVPSIVCVRDGDVLDCVVLSVGRRMRFVGPLWVVCRLHRASFVVPTFCSQRVGGFAIPWEPLRERRIEVVGHDCALEAARVVSRHHVLPRVFAVLEHHLHSLDGIPRIALGIVSGGQRSGVTIRQRGRPTLGAVHPVWAILVGEFGSQCPAPVFRRHVAISRVTARITQIAAVRQVLLDQHDVTVFPLSSACGAVIASTVAVADSSTVLTVPHDYVSSPDQFTATPLLHPEVVVVQIVGERDAQTG